MKKLLATIRDYDPFLLTVCTLFWKITPKAIVDRPAADLTGFIIGNEFIVGYFTVVYFLLLSVNFSFVPHIFGIILFPKMPNSNVEKNLSSFLAQNTKLENLKNTLLGMGA